MHDIKTIGVGGGGRLFGGSGGDRRLRQHHPHQGLKCPRCDSLNTKFCYYNNYNLSQPRHFCKSCRRYWTKGGVLRNVPVGGGCRKTKRSSSKPRPTASSSDAASAAPHGRKSNSRSSSESSSLTASATAAPDVASSAVSSNSAPSSAPLNFPSSRMFNFPQTANASSGGDTPAPLTDHLSIGRGIFPAEVGSFTSMMTAPCDPSLMEFNFAGISESPYGLQLQSDGKVVPDGSTNNQQQWTHQQGRIITGEATTMPEDLKVQFPLDQTAQIDHLSGNHSGLETLDWRGGVSGGDQELFDLSYWNQPQWTTDSDQILYLP